MGLHANYRSLSGASPPASAQGKDELWEISSKMDMPGMPMAMPEQVTSMCRPVRKPTPVRLDLPKQDKNCTISDLRQTATKVIFTMTCTGKDAMTGTGEMESLGPDANRGKIHITKVGKEDVDMTQEFSSRKTGTCVYEDPQAKMAAMTAEMCLKEAEALNPAAFMKVGSNESPCKPQQPVLCKKAAPVFAASRTSESFKKNSSDHPLPQLAEVCGLDYAGTRKVRRSALARLKDAHNPANSLESRFDLTYNAAHALYLAALRWHGYRSGDRFIVFQVLPHTLGLGPEVWRVLAKCHDIRNLGEYEGDLNVDERIVADLIDACGKVAIRLDELK